VSSVSVTSPLWKFGLSRPIQNDKSIGQFVHMRQVVLDVDAGRSALFDGTHEVEHLLHFLDRERNGGLVENDQVASKYIARPIAMPWRSPPESFCTGLSASTRRRETRSGSSARHW